MWMKVHWAMILKIKSGITIEKTLYSTVSTSCSIRFTAQDHHVIYLLSECPQKVHQDCGNYFGMLTNSKLEGEIHITFWVHLFNMPQYWRALIERKVEGMQDLIPLSVEEFRKPLGPGYKAGWITSHFTVSLSAVLRDQNVSKLLHISVTCPFAESHHNR